MLIRWANENDIAAWLRLATEMSQVFEHPADMGADTEFLAFAKDSINSYEALTAVDYMTSQNLGFIAFSRAKNQIMWFAVSKIHRNKAAGDRLLKTALRQLDTNKNITVITFTEANPDGKTARHLYKKHGFLKEKQVEHRGLPRSEMTRLASGESRGGSFHYRYPEFITASREENCPVCNDLPAPDGQINIILNEKICICAEYPGQGRLFGKLYVMPMKHAFHFEDMPEKDMIFFMNEVQRTGRALRKVTGAEKINYEMHANSGAHLHIHLFPRYLNDDFPSAPIDYRISEPPPYESYEEFLWFVEQMRQELK